jgi:hypothetical protein
MSTIKVDTIKNTSNVEVFTAKAWVNFNGTNTVAIRASGNVTSITDNGTGDYTVSFTNAISDANYSVLTTAGSTYDSRRGAAEAEVYSYSTTSVVIRGAVSARETSEGGFADWEFLNVAVFR